MDETRREHIIVAGKAFALCVLLMSFSGSITATSGVEYFQPSSFVLCGLVATAFFFLTFRMRDAFSRQAFGIIGLAIAIAWCILLTYVGTGRANLEATAPLVFLLAASGRIATLFINIQWNFHFSLNQSRSAARLSASAILLATGLFLVSQLFDGAFSIVFVIGLMLISSLLNLYLVVQESASVTLPSSLASVRQSDRRSTVAGASLPKTRFLYFGTRVAYGIGLGVLLCLTSFDDTPLTCCKVNAALLALTLFLVVGGIRQFGKNSGASLYLVSIAPIVATALVAATFFGESPLGLSGLLMVFVELAWSTQNIFQLPTYRRMTAIDPAVFSYWEYAAQIIPYYFTVAWLYPLLAGLSLGEYQAITELLTIVLAVALFSFSIGAIIRHIVQYQPAARENSDKMEWDGSHKVPKALLNVLTPRECDVFALLASGYSRPYIAKTLYLADGTVKTHIRHIYAKLSVNSQDELIEQADRAVQEATSRSAK